MQWQRVLHGCGGAISNAARVHSVYEFTVREFPGQLVRVKVLETPLGQFIALPDHAIEADDERDRLVTPATPTHSPEKALQEAVCQFTALIRPPVDRLRLVKLQNW